jgi:dipeptidyl-peptidase III
MKTKIKNFLIIMFSISIITSCGSYGTSNKSTDNGTDTFKYFVEKFADLKILRYQVPGFDTLSLKQKELLYYLSQAALAGRDILWDQNGKYNLAIRKVLENIVETYKGDRKTPDFDKFMVYTKRVWFSNGIYHHYSTDKILPEFSKEYFMELTNNSDKSKFTLPEGKDFEQLLAMIIPVIFDPDILPKRVWLNPSKDLVKNSACNFYEGVSEKEVAAFYNKMKNPKDTTPVSYGLNSKLINKNGKLVEEVWRSGGMYGPAIDEIIKWLEKASAVTENEKQKKELELLISYYKTGNLKTWDEYNIIWAKNTEPKVDYVNGFIEVYGDPLGLRATWESVVNFRNDLATERTIKLSNHAQWFEDNSPVDSRFKKLKVKGVSAKVITVAQLGGDCHPSTPIGINLPNAEWIRKDYGSKSVTIENIMYAYDQASKKSGFLEEFAASQEEIDLIRKYSFGSSNLHTDLHECLGHGSGQLLTGVNVDALKNYFSTLEETRADLFGLYYLMDPKIIELGLLPSQDAAKAEYMGQMRNGLMTQLVRLEPGKDVEEAHMRNRQLIARWCYEHGKKDNVIEFFKKDGKTYVRINNFEKLRSLFGQLLAEVQRIKSEGDYKAGKALVENYAVKVDQELLKEVKERYAKLNLAPYSGFINPVLTPVEKDGKTEDIKIEYPDDFTKQMLEYGNKYSYLPIFN